MSPNGADTEKRSHGVPQRLTLDPANALALLGGRRLRISPRAFAVLHHLVTRAGELVDKHALYAGVWRDAVVGDGALVVCIRELREAFGDDARRPQYIETVHRRGYRYIGPLASERQQQSIEPAELGPRDEALIGREEEISALIAHSERARQGDPQLIFIAGEPGIGKTTLVNAFLARIDAHGERTNAPRIVVGHCVEDFGATEAFFPLLQAMDQLCRGADGCGTVDLLEQIAPTWIANLPGRLEATRYETILRRVRGFPPSRMLRELAGALEQLSSTRLLVVVLEDLHWGDPSTVAALNWLARHRAPARLMIIATYRPEDVLAGVHPLHAVLAELGTKGLCRMIAPRPWTCADIADYLHTCASHSASERPAPGSPVIRLLERHTEGNPLFVRSMVADLRESGLLNDDAHGWHLALVATEYNHCLPTGLQPLLMRHGASLSSETRALLEAASICGQEFSAASVAAAVQCDIDVAERCLSLLAERGRFVRRAGVSRWPDGTVAACYGFQHAVHRQAWLEQTTPATAQIYHRRIGTRKEIGWGASTKEIAAELASHFVDGHDAPRAVYYLELAGVGAAERAAYDEAINLLTLGISALQGLPPGAARDQAELQLCTALGPVLIAARGYAAPEVQQTYATVQTLSARVGSKPQMFVALYGLWTYYVSLPQPRMAAMIADRLIDLTDELNDPAHLRAAHWTRGATAMMLGDFEQSHEHMQISRRAHALAISSSATAGYDHDPGISAHSYGALAPWLLGFSDQAAELVEAGLRIADSIDDPLGRIIALTVGAWLKLLEREYARAYELASAGHEKCATFHVPFFQAMCGVFLGTAKIHLDVDDPSALAGIARHIEDYRARGGETLCPVFIGMYAEACCQADVLTEGIRAINEAIEMAERNGERWWDPELHRIRSRLVIALHGDAGIENAEIDLSRSIDLARESSARMLALRATIEYAELLENQGRFTAARDRLRAELDEFPPYDGSADLRRARAILRRLSLRPSR